MRTKRTVNKLVSLVKVIFFTTIVTASTNVLAEDYFIYGGSPSCACDGPPSCGCIAPVRHCYHRHRRHHRRHHRCHYRHVNYSSVSVYNIGCYCGSPVCCDGWTPGYEVYTNYPNYSCGCGGSMGNYDPPNGSPYMDDINADYNMTY